jgi:hypothetical protein
MSGECERCGNHTFECICRGESLSKEISKRRKLYKNSLPPHYVLGAFLILILEIFCMFLIVNEL